MGSSSDRWKLVRADGHVIAGEIRLAESYAARTKGLMFDRELLPGHGLVLTPCSSIHMFFMRFAIDVAFVDVDGKVLRVVNGIRPWRATSFVRRAKSAIELPAGTLASNGVSVGEILSLERVE